MTTHDDATRTLVIADQIKPMLHGLGPEVQGAILAELVSIWLTGHAPDIRRIVLTQWLGIVVELTAVNERMRGDPPRSRSQHS